MINYDCIYNLEEFSFIGGTTQYLFFDVYNSGGDAVDLSEAICSWRLREYGNFGNNATLITKTGVLTGFNSFKITIFNTDTTGLFGKFVQQPMVVDRDDNVFSPGQGIILISKAIN